MSDTLKTQRTKQSVTAFLNDISDEQRRKDAKAIHVLLKDVSGEKGEMWGSSIVGYGKYTYTGSNKKTNEWMAIGFSPRKNYLAVYIMPGYQFPAMEKQLAKLGKYTTGKSCLYVKKLEDVDMKVLRKMCEMGYKKIVGKHINYADNKSL